MQALAEACGANSSEACRSHALRALKLFSEMDKTLYQKIRTHLVWAYRARRGLYRHDISQLIGAMDVQAGFRAIQGFWHVSVDIVSSSITQTVSSLSNFQHLVSDPFQACASVEVVETKAAELNRQVRNRREQHMQQR